MSRAKNEYNVYVTHYWSDGVIGARAEITSVAPADLKPARTKLRKLGDDLYYELLDQAERNISDRAEQAAEEIMSAAHAALQAQLAAIGAEELDKLEKEALSNGVD